MKVERRARRKDFGVGQVDATPPTVSFLLSTFWTQTWPMPLKSWLCIRRPWISRTTSAPVASSFRKATGFSWISSIDLRCQSPPNIAEGNGRFTKADRRNFFDFKSPGPFHVERLWRVALTRRDGVGSGFARSRRSRRSESESSPSLSPAGGFRPWHPVSREAGRPVRGRDC